jgi:hypothetical protein
MVMKRYILLIACFISILVSLEASAANVTKVVITTREPMVGEKQSFKASVPETASTEIYEVHWSGEFENGRFVQGNNYTHKGTTSRSTDIVNRRKLQLHTKSSV